MGNINTNKPDQVQLYTVGYNAWDGPESLRELSEKKDNALIVDIRFSPTSRDPRYRKAYLDKTLGERVYQWVFNLGNKNYKGGPVDLVNEQAGIAQVVEVLRSGRSVILMCGCYNHVQCHRTHVAALVEAVCGVSGLPLYPPPTSRSKNNKDKSKNQETPPPLSLPDEPEQAQVRRVQIANPEFPNEQLTLDLTDGIPF